MYFSLNKAQKEFLYSKSQTELLAAGFHRGTITYLRKHPGRLKVETLAKILRLGFDISWKEFSLIE